MTKEEVIQMINEIPDSYELTFPDGLYVQLDGKECKASLGIKAGTMARFIPFESPNICACADECIHFERATL